MIHPFILSGGAGTRLWPLSRASYPKQFLRLVSEHSLIQNTCLRLKHRSFAAPSFLVNEQHRFIVAEQLQEINITPQTIILEPVSRNTAPAALTAALYCAEQTPDDLVLLLPSDHIIADEVAFKKAVLSGVKSAEHGDIVTFGIKPDRPATEYGYIEINPADEDVFDVVRFIEKPQLPNAQSFVEDSSYYWNSGMFLFSAQMLINIFEKLAPQTISICREALVKAHEDFDFLRLYKTAYEKTANISLDYAILENTSHRKMVPVDIGWSDLGAWPSVWNSHPKDTDGNVTQGESFLVETTNSFAHSEEGTCITLVGLDNVVAVAMRDAVIVVPKDQAWKISDALDVMRARNLRQVLHHPKVYRPWGWYEGISTAERYNVKRIMVKPGARLSLQSHLHRAEHWVVVSGTLEVCIEGQTQLLTENQSTYIPLGKKHRLTNPGRLPAYLIEVQSGSYLGEDDIIRYEDDYGRKEQM